MKKSTFLLALFFVLVVGSVLINVGAETTALPIDDDDVGYETINITTKGGKDAQLYKITNDDLYFQPGSVLLEEVANYDEIGYVSVGRYITYIELLGDDFSDTIYRLDNGQMSCEFNTKYWSTKKPIKIDKAITTSKKLDGQLSDGLEMIYLTKDGENIEYRYKISDLETYIIPYNTEVYTSIQREGVIKGIDPVFCGFAGKDVGPAYITNNGNYIGLFRTGIETSDKPIKGNIYDLIQNPEEFGYPTEAIK